MPRFKNTIIRADGSVNYNAGAVVGGPLTFVTPSSPFQNLMIVDSTLRVDVDTIPTGMTNFRLHFYSATPPSNYADNAAWDLPAGDRACYLDYIDSDNVVDLGSTLLVRFPNVQKVLLLADSPKLFGYLVTNGGHASATGTSKTLSLNCIGV